MLLGWCRLVIPFRRHEAHTLYHCPPGQSLHMRYCVASCPIPPTAVHQKEWKYRYNTSLDSGCSPTPSPSIRVYEHNRMESTCAWAIELNGTTANTSLHFWEGREVEVEVRLHYIRLVPNSFVSVCEVGADKHRPPPLLSPMYHCSRFEALYRLVQPGGHVSTCLVSRQVIKAVEKPDCTRTNLKLQGSVLLYLGYTFRTSPSTQGTYASAMGWAAHILAHG